MRLSKVVKNDLGVRYGQAVNACLRFPDVDLDSETRSQYSSAYAKAIMTDIVEPLRITADVFGQ